LSQFQEYRPYQVDVDPSINAVWRYPLAGL